MALNLFLSAGEASGEHYGSLLIGALRERLAGSGQTARFFGMGGPQMEAAGLERVVRAEEMAVMGLTEVLHHLPRIYGEYRKLKQAIRACRPDAAVLIDFPDFHFRLARYLHRMGVPVIFFVSPQLWAWKKHRLKLVKRDVDRMLVIFPFEEPFYREHGVQAEFVGHPLAERNTPIASRERFAADNQLDPARTWIGLLPGSRGKEIRNHLPEMLAAARKLEERQPGFSFLLPLAPTLNAAQRETVHALIRWLGGGMQIRVVSDARATLQHCRASIVASGTATVEAALIGNPFVVIYRVSPLTYAVAKRIVKVPHVAMVNLIAGRRVVPELIQNEFTASNIVREFEPLLPDGPPRQSMMEELVRIRHLLRRQLGPEEGGGAIDRVAAITLKMSGASCAAEVTQPAES